MKKSYLFYILVSLTVTAFYSFSGNVSRYPGGAPAGYTGSPSDGRDCTQCHNGTASNVENWITSTIPETGYVPGNTYDITLTVASGGKKGFEISPQSFTGSLLGELHAVSGTKLVGSGKYITHSSKVSSNPAIWTFQWTAPVEETGNVVFYGAIAINESQTKLTSLIIPEDITASINEIDDIQLNIFPNPVRDFINLSYNLSSTEKVSVILYDLNGSFIKVITDEVQANGNHTLRFAVNQSLAKGVYLLSLQYGSKHIVRKIFVQ